MKRIQPATLLPYLVALVSFYLITLSFFYPELIDGKTLAQTDIVQFEGMSKRSTEYKYTSGEETLWNDAMFSGTPDYLIATGVPEQALQFLKKFTHGFINPRTSAHLLFACLFCAWILMLSFEVNPWLAFFGAVAFALNSYNIINIDAGHVTKTWAIAYSSLVLAGINLVFRNKMLLGAGLTALGLSLQIGAPHYQITFYLAFVCAFFVISEAVFAFREKRIPLFAKQNAVLALAVVLALGTAIARLWMTQEYTPYSIRGQQLLPTATASGEEAPTEGLDKAYAFSWSQGKMETLTLLIPGLFGGGSGEKLGENSATGQLLMQGVRAGQYERQQVMQFLQNAPMYWGDQPFTVGPLYAGAIVCFLFLLAMLTLPNRQRWWMLAGAIFTMMLAWGSNFEILNYALFDYVPGFNKFRSVSMALSLTLTVMALAGTLALQQAMEGKWSTDYRKKFLVAAGVVGGICLLVIVFSGSPTYEAPSDAQMGQMADVLRQDRQSMLVRDAFRSLALVLLAAGILFFRERGVFGWGLGLGLLLLINSGDLFLIGKRYIYPEKFQKNAVQRAHQKSAADEAILQDKDLHYRVFRLGSFDKEAQTSYYHKSIGGYFAAKLIRYRDLIDRKLFPEQEAMIANLNAKRYPDFTQTTALNMLNAKYIKLSEEARGVLENPGALGNAWFVAAVKPVQSAQAEMDALNGLDAGQTAVIHTGEFAPSAQQFAVDSTANITLKSYTPRKLVYQSNNPAAGLAVFSEIYYPKGWTATIDGQEAPILRANYVLRALEIPAGQHEIVFAFNPESYTVGAAISASSGYLVALLFLLAIGFSVWKGVKE